MINSKLYKIRSASRELVRELGFLNKTIAGTKYSASAVHAIIEIDLRPSITAKLLSEVLMLEKSSVSRLIQNLVKSGEIREEKSLVDGRQKHLKLTHKGKGTLQEIHTYGNKQVSAAIRPLSKTAQEQILAGLEAYSSALGNRKEFTNEPEHVVKSGYKPGLISGITKLHIEYYNKEYGLNHIFEKEVATNFSDFVARLEKGKNEVWYVENLDEVAASIAIDGDYIEGNKAFLRWFIVDESIQSFGLGSKLMKKALDFCEQNSFEEVHLWTFEGLLAARKLYERNKFELVEERYDDTWGSNLLMQRFVHKVQ